MKKHLLPVIVLLFVWGIYATDYSTWTAMKPCTLNTKRVNITSNEIGFPVLIRYRGFGNADSIGRDLRVTKADGTTDLYFEIERWVDGTVDTGTIWVNVDTVKGNDSTQNIKMFWGKTGQTTLSNPQKTFDTANGFRAVWHLGESGDGTVDEFKDATYYAHDGTGGPGRSTMQVPVRSDSSMIGYGQTFDGSNDGITLLPDATLLPTGSYSISAWCKPSALGADYNEVFADRGDTTFFYLAPTAHYARFYDGVAIHYPRSTPAPEVGTWRYATLRGPTNSKWLVTVDGIYTAGALGNTANNMAARTDTLFMGYSPSYPTTRSFAGDLDELRVESMRDSMWHRMCFMNQRINASGNYDSLTYFGANTSPKYKTWTTSAHGNWTTGSKWDAGIAPVAGDTVSLGTTAYNCTSAVDWNLSKLIGGTSYTGIFRTTGFDTVSGLCSLNTGSPFVILKRLTQTGDANAYFKITNFEMHTCTLEVQGTGTVTMVSSVYTPYKFICAASGKTTTIGGWTLPSVGYSNCVIQTGGGGLVLPSSYYVNVLSNNPLVLGAGTTITGTNATLYVRANDSRTITIPKLFINTGASGGVYFTSAVNSITSIFNYDTLLTAGYLALLCYNAGSTITHNLNGDSVYCAMDLQIGSNNATATSIINTGGAPILVGRDFDGTSYTAGTSSFHGGASAVKITRNFALTAEDTLGFTSGTVTLTNTAKATITTPTTAIQKFNNLTIAATSGQTDSCATAINLGGNLTVTSGRLKMTAAATDTIGGNASLGGVDSVVINSGARNWVFPNASTITQTTTGKRATDSLNIVALKNITITNDSTMVLRSVQIADDYKATLQAGKTLQLRQQTGAMWSGSAGHRDSIVSSSDGNAATVALPSAIEVEYAYFKDIITDSTVVCTTGCYDGGGNSGVNFGSFDVTGVSPSAAPAAGGYTVTLTGLYMGSSGGSAVVYWAGGNSGTITLLTQTSASATFTMPELTVHGIDTIVYDNGGGHLDTITFRAIGLNDTLTTTEVVTNGSYHYGIFGANTGALVTFADAFNCTTLNVLAGTITLPAHDTVWGTATVSGGQLTLSSGDTVKCKSMIITGGSFTSSGACLIVDTVYTWSSTGTRTATGAGTSIIAAGNNAVFTFGNTGTYADTSLSIVWNGTDGTLTINKTGTVYNALSIAASKTLSIGGASTTFRSTTLPLVMGNNASLTMNVYVSYGLRGSGVFTSIGTGCTVNGSGALAFCQYKTGSTVVDTLPALTYIGTGGITLNGFLDVVDTFRLTGNINCNNTNMITIVNSTTQSRVFDGGGFGILNARRIRLLNTTGTAFTLLYGSGTYSCSTYYSGSAMTKPTTVNWGSSQWTVDKDSFTIDTSVTCIADTTCHITFTAHNPTIWINGDTVPMLIMQDKATLMGGGTIAGITPADNDTLLFEAAKKYTFKNLDSAALSGITGKKYYLSATPSTPDTLNFPTGKIRVKYAYFRDQKTASTDTINCRYADSCISGGGN